MRAVGNGSLIRRNKLDRSHCRDWQMRVYTEDAEGRRHMNTRPFHGTWSQGQRALALFRAELERDGEQPPDITVSGYAESFLSWLAASGRSESTVEKVGYNIRALTMHIGQMRMGDVKPADIERAYALMRRGQTPSGRPWRETTLATANASAFQMFKRAERDGIIASNPFERIDAPRPDTPEKKALAQSQAVALLSALDPAKPMECMCMLMLTMGLRRSEAVRVRRSDVSDGMLHIPKSKTRAGIRSLPLNPQAADAVAARMEAQALQFDRLGAELHDDERLCATPGHREMEPHAVTKWWERNCSRLGMDGWTPHELRHSFLTLLAESGASPKVMQELAGHESPVTTLKIYTHVHDEQKRSAMDALGGLFSVDSGSSDPSVTHDADGKGKGQEA